MKQKIATALENLGLTKRQAKIYLACLEFGPLGITDLSKKSQQKKTTTFDTVNLLVDKNFLTVAKRGNQKVFAAEKPEILKDIHQEKLDNFDHAIPDLNLLVNQIPDQSLVKYYIGKKGIKQILEEMLNCQDKTVCHWGSFNISKKVLGPKYLQSLIRRRVRRGIKSRTIRLKGEKVKEEFGSKQTEYLREIRYSPMELLVGSILLLYDNRVAFISSQQEGFGFVVENSEFSKMMKRMFTAFWQLSEPKTESDNN